LFSADVSRFFHNNGRPVAEAFELTIIEVQASAFGMLRLKSNIGIKYLIIFSNLDINVI
jgi:hypothetical protein